METKYPHRVQPIIIEKIPYIKCLHIKRNCHVVFDHMRGWFGIASLESLSQGKPVIAGLDDWNVQCIKIFTGASELPWVIARNQIQHEETLETLINDSQMRNNLGKQSRLFMETCWTEQHVLKVLFDVYETL